MNQLSTDIAHFFVVGINYKKTDAAIRGQFAVNQEQYLQILHLAKEQGIQELFIISTCNRTEIYGIAPSAHSLSQLLCSQTVGTYSVFQQLAYSKYGRKAIEHLFEVAAGLDSQILGDYEIVGQLKQAIKFARENASIGTLLERITNGALQSSKNIKTNTELSGGTVSVSFAAIQYLRANVENITDKKILLIGTGKIGKNTCKNLIDYLETSNITLLNRTTERAAGLAAEFGLQFAPYNDLEQEVQKADIVLVATYATEPIINGQMLQNNTPKILIDLSIPNNIDPQCGNLPHIQLVNVDELSKLKDETLQKRIQEVPKAKAIIAEHIQEFNEWYQMRKHVPVLKAVKQKLMDMHRCNMYIAYASVSGNHLYESKMPVINQQAIQKVVNTVAVKLRHNNSKGCHYIEAINEYIATGTNA